ncbi:MAG: hypothetical protein CO113_11540 [Elusimicrobia bacterium CG_4_9_14_3_um_filter_62_55]|nr:MAG: hypothetical protein COR54_00305 [Elusimicrobia bacterium CG22_combo_CG10-13_8_21_14_all_63_91]PJA15523.1 MAG: hypothetical protein COX66_09945 [Elusimicrobia bacterium CG_4_10_14_0_2_um_filter_63_34]PJB24857.1 MAG: hypothetical protein CO113_11540 [Elusimicrobia bacterium CG_4_9_14_3_um_filter_62_55]
MKKIVFGLGGLAALAAVAVLVMSLRINGMVKSAVEGFAPRVVGAPVTLKAVRLSPFSGKGELRGFVVGNPPGFTTPSAFELDTVRIAIDPKSLLSQVIVIDAIYIEGPRVTYEAGLKGSNIAAILANVEKFTGPAAADSGKTAETPLKPVKVRIKRFDFLHGELRLGMKSTLLQGQSLSAPLPALMLRDIGGKEGTTPDQAAKTVLKPLLASVIGAGKRVAFNASGAATDAAKQGLKSLKGLFGR